MNIETMTNFRKPNLEEAKKRRKRRYKLQVLVCTDEIYNSSKAMENLNKRYPKAEIINFNDMLNTLSKMRAVSNIICKYDEIIILDTLDGYSKNQFEIIKNSMNKTMDDFASSNRLISLKFIKSPII